MSSLTFHGQMGLETGYLLVTLIVVLINTCYLHTNIES